jgi:hypothetical protein
MRIVMTCLALVSGLATAVPGAAPRQYCDYSQPEYSASEVAAVREYGACLSEASNARTRNVLQQKCAGLVDAAEGGNRVGRGERTVACGSTPDLQRCSVRNAVSWCSAGPGAYSAMPGLYPCDEMLRRYPDLKPAVDACSALHEADEHDAAEVGAGRTRCAIMNPRGYWVVTSQCRKPRTVVPPSALRPSEP